MASRRPDFMKAVWGNKPKPRPYPAKGGAVMKSKIRQTNAAETIRPGSLKVESRQPAPYPDAADAESDVKYPAGPSMKADVQDWGSPSSLGEEQKEKGETLYATALSDEKFLEVNLLEGHLLVDIRKWFKNKQGELRPTKKGISLTPVTWMTMLHQAETISDIVTKIKNKEEIHEKFHLSHGVFVQMDAPYWTVHLRQHFMGKDGIIKPTYKGVILTHREWDALLQHAAEVEQRVPELSQFSLCITADDHQNQEGAFSCKECNPWGLE